MSKLEGNEVLGKTSCCGIRGSDIHQVQYGMEEPDNIMMGHEASGTVAEVGKKVEGWRGGDRVIISRTHSCGRCCYCNNQLPDLCTDKRQTSNGAHAD